MSQRYDIIQEIKNLSFNIKNILGWSKVLWNNFDWSGDFLLEIVEYKLKKMKRYMETDTVITPEASQEDINQIASCLDACRHLISNDFEHELIEKHYNKYNIDLESYFENINKPMPKQQKKDWEKMNKNIDELAEKYKHQLFDTLREKYNWWGD